MSVNHQAASSSIVSPTIMRFQQLPTLDHIKAQVAQTTVKMQESFVAANGRETTTEPDDDDETQRQVMHCDEICDEFEQNGRRFRQKFDRKRVTQMTLSREIYSIPASSPLATLDEQSTDRPILTVGVIREITEDVPMPVLQFLAGGTNTGLESSANKRSSLTYQQEQPAPPPSPVVQLATVQNDWRKKLAQFLCLPHNHKQNTGQLQSSPSAEPVSAEKPAASKRSTVTTSDENNLLLRLAFQFGVSYDMSVLEPALDDSIIHEALQQPTEQQQEVDLAQWFICSDDRVDGNVSVACMQNLYQAAATDGRPLQRTTFVQQSIKLKRRIFDEHGNVIKEDYVSESALQPSRKSQLAKYLSGAKQRVRIRMPDEYKDAASLHDGLLELVKERNKMIQVLCPLAIKARENCAQLLLDPNTFSQKYSQLNADEAWEFYRVVTETEDLEVSSRVYNILLRSSNLKANELGRSSSSADFCDSLDLGQLATLDALISKAVSMAETEEEFDDSFLDMFLLMYRAIISPELLVEKLVWRYISSCPLEPGGVFEQNWSSAMNNLRLLCRLIDGMKPEEVELSKQPPRDDAVGITLLIKALSNLLILDTNILLLAEELQNQYPDEATSPVNIYQPPQDGRRESGSVFLQTLHARLIDAITGITNNGRASKTATLQSPRSHRGTPVQPAAMLDPNRPLATSLSDSDLIEAIDSVNNILSSDPRILAEQIVLFELKSFRSLDIRELVPFGKSLESGEKSPTMQRCAENFNQLTSVTCTLLFWSVLRFQLKRSTKGKPSLAKKDIERNLKFLVNVAQELKSLSSFSGFLAVCIVLQDVPEKLIPKSLKATMKEIRQYMSPPFFAKYREDFQQAARPKLPYLGLIIQQLIHFNEANRLSRKIMDIEFIDVWCMKKQFSIIVDLFNPATFVYSLREDLKLLSDLRCAMRLFDEEMLRRMKQEMFSQHR